MACLSCTASITERENLTSRADTGEQRGAGGVRCRLKRSDAGIYDFLMLAEMLGEVLCWHARIIRLRWSNASATSLSVLAGVDEDPLCRDVRSLALPLHHRFRHGGGRRGPVGGGLHRADAA